MNTETRSLDESAVPGDIATPAEPGSVRSYADTFAGLRPAEMRMLVEAKRFFECHNGDRDFRASVEAGGRFTGEQRRMLKDIGVTLEPEALELLWKEPRLFARIASRVPFFEDFEDLPREIHDLLAPYPAMRVWCRWRFRLDRLVYVHKLRAALIPTTSPEYTAWRARRVGAVRNELGSFGWELDHPCHAVEMAVGCSVGCGFCAFDAGRLETVFDLSRPENRALVADVASGMVRALGWPAAHGMLYWSTEPNDNPHYVDLLRLWEGLTGAALCTATARAHEEWVRDLIDYYRTRAAGPAGWPRISVLSRGIMRRLHKAFTPMELRDTTLLMQQKDAEVQREKVPGGRARMLKRLMEADDLRNVDFENLPAGFKPPQGSIACVSGLLVNMVNRTLKLISPCYTTLEHRYGYREFDETRFEADGDFEVALRRLIKRSMVLRPYPEMPLRWRDDLKVVPQPDGFTLLSPTTRRDFRRGEVHIRSAELVGRGDMTYEQAFDALSDDMRIGPLAAMVMLESLFNRGYLCELTITRDYRARQEATDPSLREPVALAA